MACVMKGYREISAAGRTIGIVLIDESAILFFIYYFFMDITVHFKTL